MLFRIYWENKNIVSRTSKEREREKKNFFWSRLLEIFGRKSKFQHCCQIYLTHKSVGETGAMP